MGSRWPDLDIIPDTEDAVEMPDASIGSLLFGQSADETREMDHSIMNGNLNVRGIDMTRPFQFLGYRMLQRLVVHQSFLRTRDEVQMPQYRPQAHRALRQINDGGRCCWVTAGAQPPRALMRANLLVSVVLWRGARARGR